MTRTTPVRPRIIAARGDVEMAPENTLPAFESAIARGADGVELDVHLSADGELVVHHFCNLGSSDDGQGLVGEHTLAELKALDSGGWFDERFAGEPKPTLAEVLALCKGRARLEIDLKDSSADFLYKVLEQVERFDVAGDVELTTAHYPLLTLIAKLSPGQRTGTFFYEPPGWMPVRLAQKQALDWAELLGIAALHLNLALVTADFVGTLHARGYCVHGSNLDTPAQIRQGSRLGIDQFSTSRLGLALRTRQELAVAGKGLAE